MRFSHFTLMGIFFFGRKVWKEWEKLNLLKEQAQKSIRLVERESTQTENTSRIVQSDKCTHLERKKLVALNNSSARHAYTQYAYRVEKV